MNKHCSILLLAVVLFLASCTDSWKTFEKGDYNGQTYEIQSRQVRGFTNNRIEHRFRVGKLSPIEVDAHTTDWGPPYSDDIYGTAAFEYFKEANRNYDNNPDPISPKGRTMLYFSDKEFSEAEYEKYAAFMRDKWMQIDKILFEDGHSLFPHIIGIVYGSMEDFTKEFKGTYMGNKATFTVENDGRVRLLSEGGEYGHNLSLNIQMPGKKILMDTTVKEMNIDFYKSFKNEKGADPTKFFEFVPVSAIPRPKY